MPAAAPQRGETVRIRDERWTVAESSPYRDATILTVVGSDRANRGCRTRYLLPFEPFERLPSLATPRLVSRRRWRQRAREVLAGAVPSMDSLRAAATADIAIHPYQLEPALALVSGLSARMLIADEVGLGKTVQAGLMVAETLARRHDAHVLVLCPAGLRAQWHEELTTRFRLAPVVLDSASLQRLPLADGTNPWAAHSLILTSTDYIKRPEVVRALEPLVWDLLVVDEAHGIAGHSDRHAAATLLAQRARAVVMLTATPHSGDEVAFARLMSAGDLEQAFPLLVFRRTRAEASSHPQRRTRWLHVRPTDAELRMHRALMTYVRRVWRHPSSAAARLAMIILTRRACSSAWSLTRTVERRLAILANHGWDVTQLELPLGMDRTDDAEPDAEVGAPGLDDAHDERDALEGILRLARRAAGPGSKLLALIRLLRRSNESAIVFTEYRDTLSVLEQELTGFRTCQLHGGLTAAERAEVIEGFTTGRWQVLLATDAASEGLNLQQRCRLVIHLEVPWTPTRIEQRVGRVDRIGQSRTVHQVHLVAADTVEESRVATVVRRLSSVAITLNVLSGQPADERQVAGCVLGDDALPTSSAVVLPPGIITANVRERAAVEAARLMTTRRLQPAKGVRDAVLPCARPFVSTGHRLPVGSTWWAVWVECVDSDGQLIGETLMGVCARHRRARPGSTAGVRRFVNDVWEQIRDHLQRHSHSLAHGGAMFFRPPTAVALDREHAIALGIERRHARIAASLLQGELFDRRVERDAVRQRELLDQALARCHVRIAELQRLQTATATMRPAFSLISW